MKNAKLLNRQHDRQGIFRHIAYIIMGKLFLTHLKTIEGLFSECIKLSHENN